MRRVTVTALIDSVTRETAEHAAEGVAWEQVDDVAPCSATRCLSDAVTSW